MPGYFEAKAVGAIKNPAILALCQRLFHFDDDVLSPPPGRGLPCVLCRCRRLILELQPPEHPRLSRRRSVQTVSCTAPTRHDDEPCYRRCPWCHARPCPVRRPVACFRAPAPTRNGRHLRSDWEDLLGHQLTSTLSSVYTATGEIEYTLAQPDATRIVLATSVTFTLYANMDTGIAAASAKKTESG